MKSVNLMPLCCITPDGSILQAKSRPRLVYFPGIDGTGRLLHRQERLFEQYDVRCLQYPQDRPSTYEELAALGESQLVPAGGIVLAESFGGAVALTLALQRPDLVERLVLVNTFAYYPRGPLIRLLAYGGRFLPDRPSPAWSRRWRGRLFFAPGTPLDEQDAWWSRTADVPLRAYGMRTRLIAGLDLRPMLSSINIPAIVIVSSNDRIVPPCAGLRLARGLPRARLIEKAVGHAALIHPTIDLAQILADDNAGNARQKTRPSCSVIASTPS